MTQLETHIIKDNILSLINEADDNMLNNVASTEEVKNADFNLDGSSAPSPNGFDGCFYQTYWSIVGQDVYNSLNLFQRI